jgi:hypothetical protein
MANGGSGGGNGGWDPEVAASSDSASPSRVLQYCRGFCCDEDPWISVREHPAHIVYGEGGYGGHNTDDAINFGGANVWVRKKPTPLVRIEIPISDGKDDVELLDHGRLYGGSGDIEMTFGQHANEHHEKIGLAFRGIALGRGQKVAHAEIQFTADQSDNEKVELEIAAVAVDDFVDFETHGEQTGTDDPSGDAIMQTEPPFGIGPGKKTAMTAAVSWLPRPWSQGAAGPAQASAELRDVVNEIVGRPGWQSGNAIGFTVVHPCPLSGPGSAPLFAIATPRNRSWGPRNICPEHQLVYPEHINMFRVHQYMGNMLRFGPQERKMGPNCARRSGCAAAVIRPCDTDGCVFPESKELTASNQETCDAVAGCMYTAVTATADVGNDDGNHYVNSCDCQNGRRTAVPLGLGRIVTLHRCSFTLHQNREHIRRPCF